MAHTARSSSIRCFLLFATSLICYCKVAASFVPAPGAIWRAQQHHQFARAGQHQDVYFSRLFRTNGDNIDATEKKNETSKHVQSARSVTSDASAGVVRLPSITLAVMASVFAVAIVLPALAVDNPVDYFHLNIPNPIPDADPRYFISGGLCAAASHGITTPIDVVKTRIQANPELYKGYGTFEAATRILQTDGPSALAAGLGPTVIGYGLEGAAKFGLYESLKPELVRLLQMGDSPAIPYLIASVVAGAVASVMLCPMEKTRIRLVTDPNFASNFLSGIPQIVQESGLGSLFSGLSAMLSKQVPYTFAKQVSFDTFASLLYAFAASINLSTADVKLEVSFGAAFLASVLACLLSQPGDVILTATYKNTNPEEASTKFGSIVSTIYEGEGIQGFFAGISARFLHVGAIITSQLVLYDTIKQMLGLPATGA